MSNNTNHFPCCKYVNYFLKKNFIFELKMQIKKKINKYTTKIKKS